MSELLVRANVSDADGTFMRITPQGAGWNHVGFEALTLRSGIGASRRTGERELCLVVIEGSVDVQSSAGEWRAVGGRASPWSGPPDAVYLPPGNELMITAASPEAEVGLCWAPAPQGGCRARLLPGSELIAEARGWGAHARTIHPILMGDREAEALLVCEVLTPAGHWSSYPPHKHDRQNPPNETLLEETYYHRIEPSCGFGLQRVYTDDRSLDRTLAFGDRDCVLVPRGYHTVSSPPGYGLYYLNVMAGPERAWAVVNDPDHEWLLRRPGEVQ